MISKFWGRSAHREKLLNENSDVVKYGSVTETPQLIPSNETCVELWRIRFDETNTLTDARLNRLVECQHKSFE